MTDLRACPECLRRSWLLGAAAPYIEKALCRGGLDLSDLLGLDNRDLAEAVAPRFAESMISHIEALGSEQFASKLSSAGCWGVCRHDEHYPEPLRGVKAAPPALIARGDSSLMSTIDWAKGVSVVGSRRGTSYGRSVAYALGRELADAGKTVISGMAFGIDACAHRGALDADGADAGRTVAILSCGADVAYPSSHRSLWRRITESGLVISELPPGTGVWRWSCLARNRIIAAISGMTVVVEAAERSGSLVTANFAADYGRKLGAVPGLVQTRSAAGTNDLLNGGAQLVRRAEDVLR